MNAENTAVQETKTAEKTDKRMEKLKLLRQKREKAVSAQSAAEKKTKDISAQIAKIERDIHNDEVRLLDGLCAKKNLTYNEIADFLTALTEKMTLPEAAELLEIKKA